MGHTLQLVAASTLTLAAVLMWLSSKGPGFDRSKQAALLFAFAALVNWVLYFILA
ncbi:MAG TPA: hypothetical protein VF620_07940 [Allosphingosinicella sp.]|jgi:hypothetical protein